MILTKPIPILAPQRSEGWFEGRRGNATGSDISKTIITFTETTLHAAIRAITGMKAINAGYKLTPEYEHYMNYDPFELLEEANMDVPESEERKKYRRTIVTNRIYPLPFDAPRYATEAMKWGTINEPAAIAYYQMVSKINVTESPFFLHQTIDTETGEVDQLRCGASPDGLIEDLSRPVGMTLGVTEVKCLIPENHLYEVIAFDHMPEKYIPQVQMEMWITGRSFCDFIGFDSRAPQGLKVLIERIERDDKYINEVLEPNVRRFLEECARDERMFRKLMRERKELIQEVGTILSINA